MNRAGLFKVRTEASAYQLYNTIIYRCTFEGIVTLNSGGWNTHHTKNCINDLICAFGWQLVQRDFCWYLNTKNDNVLNFRDGMKINIETGWEV